MRLARNQPTRSFPRPYQFPRKDSRLGACLLRLCGVALRAPRRLADEVFRLVLDSLELCNIAIEFTGVRADELVAFSDLQGVRPSVISADDGGVVPTWACGSGLKKTDLMVSIVMKGRWFRDRGYELSPAITLIADRACSCAVV